MSPLGSHDGRLHARGTAANDKHVLFLRREGRTGEKAIPPKDRVHGAVPGKIEVTAIHAAGTAQAGPDLLRMPVHGL